MKVYKLQNNNGVVIQFLPLGGKIISVMVPSASGEISDVVIGYDTPEDAIHGDSYFGALCGRYANRIAKGQFTIDGHQYQLDINNGPNHLHGGFEGFNTRIWEVREIHKQGSASAWELTLTSPDGDQKYPGELRVKVIYSLSEDNSFVISYEAETTRPTVLNLTSHPYFNLRGAGTGDVLQHELQIIAENYTPIDPAQGTCLGEIAPVRNTSFDFTKPKSIESAVKSEFAQARLADGLDHNFVLTKTEKAISLAAVLKDPESGRKMEVYTDQPGIQVYTGNHFNGSELGKKGMMIMKYAGVALETQIFPNSPRIDHFPDAVLRPGEKYTHTCIYKFIY